MAAMERADWVVSHDPFRLQRFSQDWRILICDLFALANWCAFDKTERQPATRMKPRSQAMHTRSQTEKRDWVGPKNRHFGADGDCGTRKPKAYNPAWCGAFRQGEGPGDFPSPFVWWCNADLGSNSLSEQVRKDSGVCPLFAEIVNFTL